MIATRNRRVVLAARPSGMPTERCFRLEDEPMPEPGPGQVRVRGLWLSLDPYMRGRMNDAKSYAKPVGIGDVMEGGVVGRIDASENPRLAVGDHVVGQLGWREWALSDGRNLTKVDPEIGPLSLFNGLLGMPGMTAYFAFLDKCKPLPGDTVVVSAASGAVGQVVCQIARLMGCAVVGIAGSPEKCAFLVDEIGVDATLNYKTDDLSAGLAAACPNGVDVYFDNVGGSVSEAVFGQLAVDARIVICGQMSQYNLDKPELADRNLRFMLVKQAEMHGFLVWRYRDRYPEAMRRLAAWYKSGAIKYREDVVDGIENAVPAFLGLMEGRNFGKMLVRLSD